MHAPLRRLTNACYGSGACFLYDYDAGSNQAYGYLLSDPVTVTANTQYDLYAYVRGEMDSRDSEGGWIVRAYYYDSGGNGQGYQSVASGGAGTISDTWRLRGGRLTTLTNTATLRVALFNYMTSGWAAFDDVSLSPVLTDTGLATTTIRHAYDPLQRLTTATYSGATTYTFAYTYDAVGNRTVQTQTITSTLVTTYTYDAANRLTNINGQAYTWDNNGNLTNDGSKVYTYTQANRLTAVSGTGLSWSATYNGDGARLKQVVNSVPTTYTQDLASPLPVVLQAQTGTTATLYLFDVGTRPLAEYDSAWEYLLPDGLGSVRQLVDASGNVKLSSSDTLISCIIMAKEHAKWESN